MPCRMGKTKTWNHILLLLKAKEIAYIAFTERREGFEGEISFILSNFSRKKRKNMEYDLKI